VLWEPRNTLPTYDPGMLPTAREMYFKDRTLLEVDPLHLSEMLKGEGHLAHYPTNTLQVLTEAEKRLKKRERAEGSKAG
jgi:elongation factor P--beta-lysine ligase